MKFFDIVIVIGLAFFICFGTYLILALRDKGTACIVNPIHYGIEQYEKSTSSIVSCTCSFSDKRYATLFITRNTTAPLDTGQTGNYIMPKLNFSLP